MTVKRKNIIKKAAVKKAVKKKRVKRRVVNSRVSKPYNNGTMSKSAFFQMLRSTLRRRSLRGWLPIQACKQEARRPYTGPLKRQKWEYKCNICGEYFKESEISIDHINPAGQLNSFEDLPGFVERLFCEKEFLQCICNEHHLEKTKLEKEERKLKQ